MINLILVVVIVILSIYLVSKVSKRHDKCLGVTRVENHVDNNITQEENNSTRENYGQDPTIRWGVGQLSGPLFPYGRNCDEFFGRCGIGC